MRDRIHESTKATAIIHEFVIKNINKAQKFVKKANFEPFKRVTIAKMNSDSTPKAEEYRPSQRNHTRQVWWQIGFPLLLAVLVILIAMVLVVLSAMGGSQPLGKFTSISLVWLIAPMIVVAAGVLALLIAGIFGLNVLIKKLPAWTELLQMLFVLVRWRIHQFSNASVEPVMRVNTLASRLSVLTHPRRIKMRP